MHTNDTKPVHSDEYQIHPYCAAFPDVTPEEDREMSADIQQHGQRDPILLYNGQIIDGKNRLRWCQLAGVDPNVREWKPTSRHPADIDAELLAFVTSKNLKRRHLDASQRALVAAKLVELSGKNAKTGCKNFSTRQAAEQMGVSHVSVQSARSVIRNGVPELEQAVKQGQVAVSDAARVAKLPARRQRKALQGVRDCKASTLAEAATDPQTATPYDNALEQLKDVFRVHIPRIIEAALGTQRVLGKDAGNFSATAVQKMLTPVYTTFEDVKRRLQHYRDKRKVEMVAEKREVRTAGPLRLAKPKKPTPEQHMDAPLPGQLSLFPEENAAATNAYYKAGR
jgi:ParB-like chromosome segregation protein Spo0J